MSAVTYQSFNSLLCEFVSELSQTFDDYPDLVKSSEALASLMAIDDTISLPMETFYETFKDYSSPIMMKDPVVFSTCKIPYADGFDLTKEYAQSDSVTQDAIWKYLQQLFITASTVQNMPDSMLANIESVAASCIEQVKSGKVTEEQAQNPMFIMEQLQKNPELLKALEIPDS